MSLDISDQPFLSDVYFNYMIQRLIGLFSFDVTTNDGVLLPRNI